MRGLLCVGMLTWILAIANASQQVRIVSCETAAVPLLDVETWVKTRVGDRGDGELVTLRPASSDDDVLTSLANTYDIDSECSGFVGLRPLYQHWRLEAVNDGSGCTYIRADNLPVTQCASYLGLFEESPMLLDTPYRWRLENPPVAAVMTCMQCGDVATNTPCSETDAVYGVTATCPAGQAYCYTTSLASGAGVVKGCVDEATARTKMLATIANPQCRGPTFYDILPRGCEWSCQVPGCNNNGLIPDPIDWFSDM